MKNYLICKHALLSKNIHNLNIENKAKLLFSTGFSHKKRNHCKIFNIQENSCKIEVEEKLPVFLFLKNPKLILQNQEKVKLILFFELLKQFMPFTKNIPYQNFKLIKNVGKKKEFRGFKQVLGLQVFFTLENNKNFFRNLIVFYHDSPICFVRYILHVCRKKV